MDERARPVVLKRTTIRNLVAAWASGVLLLPATAMAACGPEAGEYYEKGTTVSAKYTATGGPCSDSCLEEKLYFYQRAVALCDTYPEAHNNLGDVFEKLGRYPEAIKHYSRAVELKPEFDVAFFGLGDVYFHTGDYDKAIEAYDRGLSLRPGDALATKNRELARALRTSRQANAAVIETALGGTEIKTMGPAGIRPNLRLPLYIPFAFDSDVLLPEAQTPLKELGNALRNVLAKSPSAAFVIEGHTDVRGTDEYNVSLSRRRAQTVANALAAEFGIPRDRLGLKGYGEARPFSLGSTDADHARNRRVEVVRLEEGELAWLTGSGGIDTIARSAAKKVQPLSLDAAVFYQDADRQARRLQEGMTLKSGASYRVYFQPNQSAYVYVFQVDARGKLFHLFPNADQGVRDNRVQARKAVWAPGSDDWFELDKTSGEETIYVVATRERREDVEDLFKRHRVAAAPAPEKEALQELSIVLKTMGVQNVSAAPPGKPAQGAGEAAQVVVGRIAGDGVGLARKISFRHE